MNIHNHNLPPEEVQNRLKNGQAVLIDVREEGEFIEEHIAGAQLVPVSRFDVAQIEQIAGDKEIIFTCKAGPRADRAREFFEAQTGRETFCLAGSLGGWKAAGLPTQSA